MFWSRRGDSNLRPADYKSAALPTELHRPNLVGRPVKDTARYFTLFSDIVNPQNSFAAEARRREGLSVFNF